MKWLFDGIDHPLRLKRGAATAYYELDLAGNVMALRGASGANLGGYRYTAFGQTLADTTTLTQSLRWKGRWHSAIGGGIYDVRARQWAPEIGSFVSIDAYAEHDQKTTLWGWPQQSPVRFPDPTGRGIGLYLQCLASFTRIQAPPGFPQAFILCWPYLSVPDPPAEFPSCATFPPQTLSREFCCESACGWNRKTRRSTKPRGNCTPYRGPDEDRLAEACFDRCLVEPQSF